MGKIGTTELLVVLAIVLIIFGPKALPRRPTMRTTRKRTPD